MIPDAVTFLTQFWPITEDFLVFSADVKQEHWPNIG